MIAIDTQILVYASRQDAEWHDVALERVLGLAESGRSWAIPWPCVHEFIRTVTAVKYFVYPTPLSVAFDTIERWLESDGLVLLSEGIQHLETLRRIAEPAKAVGAKIHDARIAAICLAHGVSELWSADRDFSRFPDLKVVNPLVA